MRLTREQRSKLAELIDDCEGRFTAGAVEAEYADYLRVQAEAGELRDMIGDLARSAVKEALRGRRWGENSSQPLLFEAKAVLTLGETEYIHMEDVRGQDALRHVEVLSTNHAAQTKRYSEKIGWLKQRIQALFALGCTLGELEQQEQKCNEDAPEE
jgi:hypothetical protein